MMLPKNIHFVMLGDNPPDWACDNIDRFRRLNPGWRVMVHDRRPPLPKEYDAALDAAWTVGGQSDVLRMAILEKYGGWYFDWDVFALKPLKDMESTATLCDRLLLCPCRGNPILLSWALAAIPGAPAFRTVRQIMAEIAKEGTPQGTTYERAVCDSLTVRCPEFVAKGNGAEFGVAVNWRSCRMKYAELMRGVGCDDTGDAFFVHGWAGVSPKPPVPL